MESSTDFTTGAFPEKDMIPVLMKLLNEDKAADKEEVLRLKKLLQEGKTDTVYQILSHRKAVASVKTGNPRE